MTFARKKNCITLTQFFICLTARRFQENKCSHPNDNVTVSSSQMIATDEKENVIIQQDHNINDNTFQLENINIIIQLDDKQNFK
jgi:hypothetical protein